MGLKDTLKMVEGMMANSGVDYSLFGSELTIRVDNKHKATYNVGLWGKDDMQGLLDVIDEYLNIPEDELMTNSWLDVKNYDISKAQVEQCYVKDSYWYGLTKYEQFRSCLKDLCLSTKINLDFKAWGVEAYSKIIDLGVENKKYECYLTPRNIEDAIDLVLEEISKRPKQVKAFENAYLENPNMSNEEFDLLVASLK